MELTKNLSEDNEPRLSQKPIKKMSFMLIAFACLFFFNAFINIIDIVPDFIGYIIMLVAISRLAYLNADVEASAKCFRYMICIDVSKYAALMWIFGITFGDEQNNAILLASFVYAVIEVIVLVMAFSKLFSGLTALGYVHDNTAILGSKKPNGRSYTEKIKSATFFFIVARAAFSVLPELSVLTVSEYIEGSFVMYLYEYIGTMRVLAFIFATVIGIVWVAKIFRYFRRVTADKVFCDALVARYNSDVAPNEAIFVRRQMSVFAVMLGFMGAFMLDFRFDGVSIIPDAFASVFFAIAIFAAGKLVKVRIKTSIILTVVYAAVTALRQIVEVGFFDEYYLGAVYRAPEVYNAYVKMCAVSVATVVAQLLLVFVIFSVLCKIIDKYTGFTMGEDKLRSEAKLAALHKELKIKILLIVLGAVLFAVSEIFFIFGTVKYGFADEIAFVGSIAFMLLVLKSVADVREEIDAKYILE